VQKAFQCAQKAISLNESPLPHALLSWIYTVTRQYEIALVEAERSIALGPNSADAHAWYAFVLYFAGEPEKGISLTEKALRMNPFPPSWYFVLLGAGYRLLGDCGQAIQAFRKAINKEPTNLFARIYLTATYAMSGREEEAEAQAQEALRIDPSFTLEYLAKTLPYKDQAETERVVDALRKAGLK